MLRIQVFSFLETNYLKIYNLFRLVLLIDLFDVFGLVCVDKLIVKRGSMHQTLGFQLSQTIIDRKQTLNIINNNV